MVRFRTPQNPQSGSESISESQSQTSSTGNGSNSGAIPVNLTTQRLQDWKAFLPNGAPSAAGEEVQNLEKKDSSNEGGVKKSSSNRGVTNLILLIEQGQWSAASQRAISHPHEVRQLVKLRKTTKNAPPPSSSSSAATTHAAATAAATVQISNVKCKALHHACQKLRSVHTTIYQHHSTNNSNGSSSGGRKVIQEDEYIEACKCILTLIQIHPEACKERESRHGCLPLHLAVFSMCATPPPPLVVPTSTTSPTNNAKKSSLPPLKTSLSDFLFGTTTTTTPTASTTTTAMAQRPPPISNRSTSSPNPTTIHPHPSHNLHTRDSSTDFSVGNISTMIQEESEHQKRLEDHVVKNPKQQQQGDSNNNSGANNFFGDELDQLVENVDGKKKKKKSLLKKKVGLGSSTLGTKIVGALTPLDALEEKSRETDSYSTPHNNSRSNVYNHYGDGANSTLHPLKNPPPSTTTSLRQYVSPNSSFDNKSDDGSSTRSGGTLATSSSGSSSTPNNNNATTTTPIPPSAPPTHEELQRRYLQINTRRRDEFSIRVIDALLDAWPRGPKTASEGGRLPLHMACFGKATQRVLETVLRAYPDGARQRNADGFLPIHIAAHWGVSHPDVAPLLLRAYPDGAVGRNRWERTPIEEALGMAGENGREHQMSLVWSLRRHPTYWIHNDITSMLLPRNVRNAPWRIADMGKDNVSASSRSSSTIVGGKNGSSAVDVDEVGSSDEEEEGIEVQMPISSSSPKSQNPKQVKALAESTDLSLLIARDKHWEAAAMRCKLCPHEAGEALEVKVRGAYTAKITPLLFACEHNPSVELVKALIKANPASLKRRQDPGGQLPIHAACTWGASSGVIDLLLATDPSMAEEQDFLSNLPLHCACYSGAETAIIRALLRVFPQSVWTRNHQGSSAMDIVKRLSHSNRREVLGLLDMTTKNLLEKKKKETKRSEEGVEVDKDNSLMWV